MPSLFLLFLLAPLLSALPNSPRHFGESCSLCECFVEYTDRDVSLPFRPYAQAATPYDSSEDACLSSCMRDESCKAAVYGLVGGRNVFTCELYDNLQGTRSPITAPYTNVYIKKGKCDKLHKQIEGLALIESDETSLKRRLRTIVVKENPFSG
uniref:Apple domain-containing protein n=1 Tax=Pristionchus pacificus TaxID=54126 RepID=A0A8R1YLC2_PRIPA